MQQKLKDKLQALANEVVQILIEKDDIYGSSWKSHEGFSAFFNTERKWSRIENMARENGYDLFAAVRSSPEGEDALKDLIGYALLTLSETHVLDHDILIDKFLPKPITGCGEPVDNVLCGKVAFCPECWSMGQEDAAHLIETGEMMEEITRRGMEVTEQDPNDKKIDGEPGPEYVNQD